MTTEAVPALEQRTEPDLDAVIRELDAGWDRLPEEALRTCQKHRELVTPRLIEVLQEAVRLGREGTVREGNAHFFALYLLTEFEAKAALPVILELFSLPDSVINDLLDDVLTETPRRVLAILGADQPDLIESLIPNRQLNEYVRWEAASALCQLVRDGRLPRAEAVERLARQLRVAVEAKDDWAATVVVSELGYLNPLEVQDEIRAAFEQELVDEEFTDWSYFKEHLLQLDQLGTCPELEHWKPSAIADTVEELRGWHWFSEEARRELQAPPRKAEHLLDEGFGDDFEVLDSVERADSGFGTIRNETPRVGRNDPCPCGSGKKYKKCCMRAGEDR